MKILRRKSLVNFIYSYFSLLIYWILQNYWVNIVELLSYLQDLLGYIISTKAEGGNLIYLAYTFARMHPFIVCPYKRKDAST